MPGRGSLERKPDCVCGHAYVLHAEGKGCVAGDVRAGLGCGCKEYRPCTEALPESTGVVELDVGEWALRIVSGTCSADEDSEEFSARLEFVEGELCEFAREALGIETPETEGPIMELWTYAARKLNLSFDDLQGMTPALLERLVRYVVKKDGDPRKPERSPEPEARNCKWCGRPMPLRGRLRCEKNPLGEWCTWRTQS